ncbi:efflux RND transporter periplasmic adaptor subunit [Vibrio astriarenae]|uniref:Efflux RND transporter periplasmic adaptor subunit n=1 Tax=Vibrio astriarenae TaxID=1481923 RepID=A0A7Z2T3H4_9VIBR|nr:efflux RND transporter periplasmic adaptor subunit [Vibrio astriarenae]QIA63585.1 efflux RND transporter periplasmic adaptor subunit [Vibrio astriarenae]
MKNNQLILPIILSAALAGCERPTVEPKEFIPSIRVVPVGENTEIDSLYFPAIANAAERSHLSFRVTGEISKLVVKEGDMVQEGDVIAMLDPTDYQIDVDNAEARFSVIDSQVRRSKPLVAKGLLAQSQYDEISAERQIAKAELELAKLRLSFTTLRSPMAGIVSRVVVDRFENIQVGQNIVNVHSVDDVEVVIQLPDQLYQKQPSNEVFNQIKAQVKVPSGNEYLAKIKEFTTQPDPATGTFSVTLSLPMPEDDLILDGMAVEVTSNAKGAGLHLNAGVKVPIETVFNEDGDSLDRANKFVWVYNQDNTVTKRKVVVGNASQNHLQIVDGLENGELIVSAGLSRLRDGISVSLIEGSVAQEAGNE